MFWTFIRWGGTVAIVLLVLAAAFLATQSSDTGPGMATPAEPGEATPVEIAPADSAPQQNKNFNL